MKNKIILLAGAILGGFLGYLYYIQIGCDTGACAITSNPYISTIYGAVLGFLIFNLFTKSPRDESKKPPKKEDDSIQ